MIAGSDPVDIGSAFVMAGGMIARAVASGISRLHLAQESVQRIDARGHLGDLGEFGAAGADRLARGLEGGPVGIPAHQRRVFFAEARQPDGVLGQRITDHRADDVALLGGARAV